MAHECPPLGCAPDDMRSHIRNLFAPSQVENRTNVPDRSEDVATKHTSSGRELRAVYPDRTVSIDIAYEAPGSGAGALTFPSWGCRLYVLIRPCNTVFRQLPRVQAGFFVGWNMQ